ncbi:Polyketide cyclase / dehydrase and lipid transport [Musa troglodytarum]|uniref:Polyketide cyclase / dehydrase and lipid transport n=1 Tax=Musa troglodytarum TaxID=320322 RepID=A0A9E7LB57_9LILI|nr:Polyketide cyclase / dehydrase and lipid transport [Musa troglodytarum]
MEQDPPEKWEGKASAKLLSTNADEAWSLLSDFCSLHLWLPGLVETCRKTAGDEGRPGCVRYCASPPGDDGNPLSWAYEELLAFDPAERSFRCKVADNNVGLKRYVATFKVVRRRRLRARVVVRLRPANGWTGERLTAFMQTGIEVTAKRVEEALKVAAAATANTRENVPDVV